MEKANNPYNLSPATLRALERFGPDKSSNRSSGNRLEPLPLPGADWELWAHMPKATLTEAVAVSLGIDPSAIKRGGGYAEPGIEFDRRLKLASAFVNDAGPLKPIGPLGALHLLGGPVTAVVSLPEFAKWALGMGWTLPEKFPRFKAAAPQLVTAKTTPFTQNSLYVAIQHIVKSELQKHNPAPAVPTEPPAPLMVTESASDSVEPDAPDWRMQIQAEAYERWLRLRASGCNPTVHSICDDIAKWCIEQNIKGGKGQNPRAGTIRNTVLGAGHWTPPHHSVAEAKKHVAQIARTAQTQVAQISW